MGEETCVCLISAGPQGQAQCQYTQVSNKDRMKTRPSPASPPGQKLLIGCPWATSIPQACFACLHNVPQKLEKVTNLEKAPGLPKEWPTPATFPQSHPGWASWLAGAELTPS